MSVARVAIASCRLEADSPPTSLYPDPDAPLLADAFARVGVTSVEHRSWDDPGVDWTTFDRVVIRSTWDSVDRPREFLAWASGVGDALVNPYDVVAWGLDKRYLRDLEADGLPVVPTVWIEPGPARPPVLSDGPDHDVVVKPAVSAGGRSTVWHRAGARDAIRSNVEALLAAGHTVLVQPHLPGVHDAGEMKTAYIGGTFSHAVRVGPLLERDEGVLERPWERAVSVEVMAPTAEQLAVGRRAVESITARFGGRTPAYARVDLAPGLDGAPCILEVELIDPVLSLRLVPETADRLAAAVVSASSCAGPASARG